MKSLLVLLALAASAASASTAQAPAQPFSSWLSAQITAASIYADITQLSQDGMHFYFAGRRDALLEVRTRLP